ncbi:MAG: YggT family protein [Verrucomicrobia bacterium]|nr:YggT family protein [Verrucomicrobiota bacterium]
MFLMIRTLVSLLFNIYVTLLFIRILASWFPQWNDQAWMVPVKQATDPYLNTFRKIVPPIGGLDFSPTVALLALFVLEWLLLIIL